MAKKKLQKVFSLLLAMSMALSLLSLTAFAAGEDGWGAEKSVIDTLVTAYNGDPGEDGSVAKYFDGKNTRTLNSNGGIWAPGINGALGIDPESCIWQIVKAGDNVKFYCTLNTSVTGDGESAAALGYDLASGKWFTCQTTVISDSADASGVIVVKIGSVVSGSEEDIYLTPDGQIQTYSITLTVNYYGRTVEAGTATATLTLDGSDEELATQTSDAAGQIVFTGLDSGTYHMTVRYANEAWGVETESKTVSAEVNHADAAVSVNFSGNNQQLVKYFLRLNAVVADTTGNVASRPTGNYTPALWASPAASDLARVSTEETDSNYAAASDAAIRAYGTAEEGDAPIASFPTDEEVFAYMLKMGYTSQIRVVGADKKTMALDAATLDTNHYSIRWYVFKEESDCMHIDGILVAKSASLTVSKTFYGLSAEDAATVAQQMGFSLMSGSDTFSVLSNPEVIANGDDSYTYTWSADVPWGVTYTVRENNYGLSGKNCVSQYATATNINGTEVVNSDSVNVTVVSQAVDQGDGANTVVFCNAYDDAAGSLRVTKKFVGAVPADFAASFEVRNNSNAVVASAEYSEFVDGTYTFTDLPAGTYYVAEVNAAAPEGYTMTTSYSASSAAVTGDSEAVPVIVVTNTYALKAVDTDTDTDNAPPVRDGDDTPASEIPETETPLTEIPETETPLTEIPEAETPLAEIPEDKTPLAQAPETGDSGLLLLSAFGTAASLLGLAYVTFAGRKQKEN